MLKYPGLSRAKILIKMVGTKKESVYRKKRKGKGFGGSKRKAETSEETPAKESKQIEGST